MEVEFKQGQGIEQYLEALIGDVEFVWLDFEEDGLISNCINKAHTLVFRLECTPSFFDKYSIDNNDLYNHIFVDVNEFAKILKRAKKNETIHLSCFDNCLNIKFIESDRHIEHTLSSDNYEDKMPFPQIPGYDYKLKYSLKDMSDIVKDLEVIKATTIVFSDCGKSIEICNESDSVWNSYCKTIDIDKEVFDSFRIGFNLDLFSKTLKFNKINDEVVFELKDEMPIKIGYEGDNIDLKCILAPLIEAVD